MIEDPSVLIAEIRRATDRLIGTAERMSDRDVAAPSRLPDWTRGHVLTHVSRNAEALANLLESARTGVSRPAYASREARDAAIETGAPRPAAAQVADLRASAEHFDGAAEGVPGTAWQVAVQLPGGPGPAWKVLWGRWREVEVHHVDLGLAHRPADWPPEFAAEFLREVVADLAARGDIPPVRLYAQDVDIEIDIDPAPRLPTVSGPAFALAAWLSGRGAGEDLIADGPLPAVPGWR